MTGRTIAIGDIHGCAAALAAVIDAVAPTADDTIVTLGDYVDRGLHSREVLDQLLALATRCRLVPLIGNHEAMMLDALEDPSLLQHWLRCGGRETLACYGGALEGVPEEHWDFLHALTLSHVIDDWAFIHANYDYRMAWDEQPEYLALWQHLQPGWQPPAHESGKTVFVGHTPQPTGELLDLGHIVCIDTACVLGGWLTAIDVRSRRTWQADRAGKLREA
jgi:serine/threonine protein phosphatase 1